MDISEKKLTSELKMKGIIVNVYHDKAELCDGRVVGREVVEHPGGVTILPVDEDGMCYMVQQYRYPMQKLMLEAPAGKLEPGEDPMVCAVRELSEETGFSADEYIYLGAHATSPGYSTEILHIYLALGLHAGQAQAQVRWVAADGTALCTGIDAICQMKQAFGDRCVIGMAGEVYRDL